MMVRAGSEPLIDIVIPNWNGRHFLGDCLLSLRRQTDKNFRVIVVDNGSSDGSCEFLRTSFPEVEVVSLSENTGFSYAINSGISVSRAPLILLLNNDIEVAEDCIERLTEALERYPDIDAFALKMINFSRAAFDRWCR
jgi:GT2 family glycosyltransferase